MQSTYFNVQFFGSAFGVLDGKSFIYREARFSKIVEIKDKLLKELKEEYEDYVQVC